MHCIRLIKKVLDCVRGLEYAIKLGWFNYKTFSLAEYEHYERLENGDLNWIIPQKFIAFSSPSDRSTDKYGVGLALYRTEPLLPMTTFQYSKNWGYQQWYA
jgi:hypothetical protein